MTERADVFRSLTPEARQALRSQMRGARSQRTWNEASGSRPTVERLSLYFFASTDAIPLPEYFSVVLEAAGRADAAGLHAVWVPERHFVPFGGQHPNPAVLAAAIAARTTRIAIRAGSVAAPLHHPIRIAEEWALVDNLSGGRVGASFASGWHPDDFVLARDRYDDRRQATLRIIDEVRDLWAGEASSYDTADGDTRSVRITPRPIQRQLPMWLTAAGSPATFEAAGRAGCGVMTALLGQTLPELRENIARYRAAWRDAGHDGHGDVVVMVHAHVSDAPDLEELLRPAMHAYLKAYRRQTSESAEDDQSLLEAAFQNYLRGPSLLGTSEKARAVLAELADAGADEVGCLVDFGLSAKAVLDGLDALFALNPRQAPG
jgi:natural product biosynthesis luciferase-like monooxygenase protein